MNLQQLEYVLAVAENRHFESAAEKCFVSQSTLSTMISRLESEIGVKIFDRKKRPVEVTRDGAVIVEQLKRILCEVDQLGELVKTVKGEIAGELSISVIPTIAPYLLPLFLTDFAKRFPDLHIKVKEQTTSEIIRRIKSRDLDIGILSIPVDEKDLQELKLYDEPFIFYDAGNSQEEVVSAKDVDMSNLCLLEEGHCMRTQVIRLCELHKKRLHSKLSFEYEAGSIDSLLRFVKGHHAATLLPYLVGIELPETERRHISQFSPPVPFRSVGMVVHRHFVKQKVLEALHQEIMEKISEVLPQVEMAGRGLTPV